MPNYEQIEKELIPARKPFTHAHSMRATLTDGVYRIYSYNTQIANVNLETGIIGINLDKYSSTTTRQQNLVKRALGVK
jgi:hypothetical protein